MDPKQFSSVRRQVTRAKNAGGRIRYSESVRRAVLDWVRSGVPPIEVSELTGLPLQTLLRWSSVSADEFRRVAAPISSAASSSFLVGDITVEFASGLRLSCPSIGLAIEALELFK